MTAKEILYSLESRFITDRWNGKNVTYHLLLEGENGGDFTVQVQDGKCTVQEGLMGTPDCIVKSSAKTYEEIETGKTKAQVALFMGKLKISNIPLMLQFTEMFKRLEH